LTRIFRTWNFVRREDGAFIPQHVGDTPLIFTDH